MAVVFLVAQAVCLSRAHGQSLDQQHLEQAGPAQQPTPKQTFSGFVGAGVVLTPAYEGSSIERVRPLPLYQLNYGRLFFSNAGLGVIAYSGHGWSFGPLLGQSGGRSQVVDSHLQGLRSIPTSMTVGVLASYTTGAWEFTSLLERAVRHRQSGGQGFLSLDHRQVLVPHELGFILGAGLELGDERYNRTWFGVSSQQSADSGLSEYTAHGGVNAVGVHARLNYLASPHVLIPVFAELKQLTGSVRDSPIVERRTVPFVGLGIAYRF
jgi:MipA family protein